MHTQTHMLIASGLMARRSSTAVNWAAALGGLLPDVPMFVMFAWNRFVDGISPQVIFDQLYFQPTWQTTVAIAHSIPLSLALLGAGFALKWDWLKVFAAAVLLHIAFDLPLHVDDAHAHFWPFTMWIFESPVSYWDRRHYGGYVMVLEIALALVMMAVLWRRFPSLWVRALMGVAAVIYVAVPAYFILTFGLGPGPDGG
jgi:hypothetical protein